MQQANGFCLGGRAHFDFQAGKFLGEGFQRLAPAAGLQLGGHGDGQALFQALVQLQGLGVEQVELADHLPGLGLQGQGGTGGQGFARGPVEQHQVQLSLQLGDGHAHGRRHTPQLARGGRERACLQHREEDCQGVAGKGHCQ